jgi:hypothetical protein
VLKLEVGIQEPKKEISAAIVAGSAVGVIVFMVEDKSVFQFYSTDEFF